MWRNVVLCVITATMGLMHVRSASAQRIDSGGYAWVGGSQGPAAAYGIEGGYTIAHARMHVSVERLGVADSCTDADCSGRGRVAEFGVGWFLNSKGSASAEINGGIVDWSRSSSAFQ